MGARTGTYAGTAERSGSGDEACNQDVLEQVIGNSPALESAYREIAEFRDTLAQEKLHEEELCAATDLEGIVGKSSTLRRVLQLVKPVAPSVATVLLLGETGTGKELIARAIHSRSRHEESTLDLIIKQLNLKKNTHR
jgi:transcriptional regulator with GAF, ATPase, and Fis domain